MFIFLFVLFPFFLFLVTEQLASNDNMDKDKNLKILRAAEERWEKNEPERCICIILFCEIVIILRIIMQFDRLMKKWKWTNLWTSTSVDTRWEQF